MIVFILTVSYSMFQMQAAVVQLLEQAFINKDCWYGMFGGIFLPGHKHAFCYKEYRKVPLGVQTLKCSDVQCSYSAGVQLEPESVLRSCEISSASTSCDITF